MNNDVKSTTIIPRGTGKKAVVTSYPVGAESQARRQPAPGTAASLAIDDELAKLRAAATAVHQIRVSAQHELEMARKMRADAQKYQQQTETQARSRAYQLILHTRLETQKEIEELIRNASGEIQKVLADIRAIRITAQEELATQQKFTNAAKLRTMAISLQAETQEETEEVEVKSKKQLAYKK